MLEGKRVVSQICPYAHMEIRNQSDRQSISETKQGISFEEKDFNTTERKKIKQGERDVDFWLHAYISIGRKRGF